MLLPRVLCPLQPGGAAFLDGQFRDPRPLRILSSPKRSNSLGVGGGCMCARTGSIRPGRGPVVVVGRVLGEVFLSCDLG